MTWPRQHPERAPRPFCTYYCSGRPPAVKRGARSFPQVHLVPRLAARWTSSSVWLRGVGSWPGRGRGHVSGAPSSRRAVRAASGFPRRDHERDPVLGSGSASRGRLVALVAMGRWLAQGDHPLPRLTSSRAVPPAAAGREAVGSSLVTSSPSSSSGGCSGSWGVLAVRSPLPGILAARLLVLYQLGHLTGSRPSRLDQEAVSVSARRMGPRIPRPLAHARAGVGMGIEVGENELATRPARPGGPPRGRHVVLPRASSVPRRRPREGRPGRTGQGSPHTASRSGPFATAWKR